MNNMAGLGTALPERGGGGGKKGGGKKGAASKKPEPEEEEDDEEDPNVSIAFFQGNAFHNSAPSCLSRVSLNSPNPPPGNETCARALATRQTRARHHQDERRTRTPRPDLGLAHFLLFSNPATSKQQRANQPPPFIFPLPIGRRTATVRRGRGPGRGDEGAEPAAG